MLALLASGLLTTVQDTGRLGAGHLGLSPAGAMDDLALRFGNLLVGNQPEAAGLEMTLIGPEIEFETETRIALTGSDFQATLDEQPLALWRSYRVVAGQRLRCGSSREGARAYLCIAGGIDVPLRLGSRATHVLAGLGGLEGRPLRAGDRLPIGDSFAAIPDRHAGPDSPEWRVKPGLIPHYHSEITLRVLLGPQAHCFTQAGLQTFLNTVYTVSSQSNRMGVRLSGAAIERIGQADILSEGIAPGAVQVPEDGQPIVLTVERQTTGGYTKIATVVGADLDRLGQSKPGDRVRFQTVTLSQALSAWQARANLCQADSLEPVPARSPGHAEAGSISAPSLLLLPQVQALLESFAASTLNELELRIDDLWLAARHNAQSADRDVRAPAPDSEALHRLSREVSPFPSAAREDTCRQVRAPLAGIWHVAPAPSAEPFVRPGQAVVTGQLLGIIEIMKTMHRLTAPAAGVIQDVLVTEGDPVGEGQVMVVIREA